MLMLAMQQLQNLQIAPLKSWKPLTLFDMDKTRIFPSGLCQTVFELTNYKFNSIPSGVAPKQCPNILIYGPSLTFQKGILAVLADGDFVTFTDFRLQIYF